MDLQLPVIDGYAATRRIKANPIAGIPVIAVTSYAFGDDESKALAAGCDVYVSKPFSPRRWMRPRRMGRPCCKQRRCSRNLNAA
jgi:two-component system cell cycle response regulator DivK